MPYTSTEDLPPNVKDHLPKHAQEIFVEAFNDAYEHLEGNDEAPAFRIAWGAVKRTYEKRDGKWVAKKRRAS